MIEIAGGIILALFILAFLPWILFGLSWVFSIALALVVVAGAVWLIWTGSQFDEGFAIELIVGGVFLIWLGYEIKARRDIKAERQAKPPGAPAP